MSVCSDGHRFFTNVESSGYEFLLGLEEQQNGVGIEKHKILIVSLFYRFVIVLLGDFKMNCMFTVLYDN